MAKVTFIDKGSIAEELGVEIGDELIGFNGKPIQDILDYCYYDSQESFIINMKAKQGDLVDLEIEKDVDEPIGMSLDHSVQLTPIRCKNKCVFCFVDQLPKGMRDTLYVKDDDYRLSFISGNYVTFTNTTQKELDRIVDLHLSPLYISVHCFDRDLKTKLIANPEGAKLFDKMNYLKDNGIIMHTQIVMCKNLNDGEKLLETISELHKLSPAVATVAVVPVGLTGHRDNLAKLEPIDPETASKTIKLVENFNQKVGGNFCWCSDEFYVKAGISVPPYSEYGEFYQIENGVGLCAEFDHDLTEALLEAKKCDKKIEIACITGQSFKGYLGQALEKVKRKYPNLVYNIHDIVNNFFGSSITVAGLITGKDIMAQVDNLPAHTIIPSNMLREFTDMFLDGTTVKTLAEHYNTTIHVSHGGDDLVRIIGEITSE